MKRQIYELSFYILTKDPDSGTKSFLPMDAFGVNSPFAALVAESSIDTPCVDGNDTGK